MTTSKSDILVATSDAGAGPRDRPRAGAGARLDGAAAMIPDDQTLTEHGLQAQNPRGKVLLIACGALAREILALIRINGWEHMDLVCLPAILHNHPDKICDAVAATVAKRGGEFDTIKVAYADCGTGGQLFDLCNNLGLEMIKGPHCYSFYDGHEVFHKRSGDETTAFFMTDFLVRQFDAFVWKPLGLDRHPGLLDSYFGHYEKLIYQAQTDDAALDAKARDCAERLGLAYERRFTGYGDLETTLRDWASAG